MVYLIAKNIIKKTKFVIKKLLFVNYLLFKDACFTKTQKKTLLKLYSEY